MTSGRNPQRQKIGMTALVLLAWLVLRLEPVTAQNAPLRLHELQLADRGEQKIVSVRFSQPPTSVTSFALDSPPRVVVDVKGATQRLASTTYPAQDPLVKQVRVGFHKDYVRFVLDLKVGMIPPFSATQDKNLVTVTLGRQTKAVENTKSHLIFFTRQTRQAAHLSSNSSSDDSPRFSRTINRQTSNRLFS